MSHEICALKKGASFVEVDVAKRAAPRPWSPLHVPKAAIEAEIERLCDLPGTREGRRAAEIVHPEATDIGYGLAPGLSVSINVLLPGEQIEIARDNASRVEFATGGEAQAIIGHWPLSMSQFDAWNIPSMTRRSYRNLGSRPFTWLSYSNAPLLDRLGIHYSDDMESRPLNVADADGQLSRYVRANAPDIAILDSGARLRGYEFLTDIEVVDNKCLIWPWAEVSKHVAITEGADKRTIMLLYNPATERRNGTTHSFFATISGFPPNINRPVPSRGHKHSSFACNYHFMGSGASVVDGQRFEWEAGDLMLSAPSWSEHAHGTSRQGSAVLTIQDHPFQIGIEALIWQEKMDGPILTLGSEPGQTGYVGPRFAGE